METCKELLNIFVEENWIDVFKQSEYFSQYMEPKKGNSVMEDLFEALATRNLTK